MGPEMVREFQELINALEADEQVRVVVFDSAVDDDFFESLRFHGQARRSNLNADRSHRLAALSAPVRLTRLPVASIALIRGRATGNGSEITLSGQMKFRQPREGHHLAMEVGVGMVAGGGPMARLPQLIGSITVPLIVLLSSEDIRADQAERPDGYNQSRSTRRRTRRVCRGARDADRQVRQMGDRQHQATRQH